MAVESTADELVGSRVCGGFASRFAGAEVVQVNGLDHTGAYFHTLDEQLAIFEHKQFDYGGWLSFT